jgi:hypothetical protein
MKALLSTISFTFIILILFPLHAFTQDEIRLKRGAVSTEKSVNLAVKESQLDKPIGRASLNPDSVSVPLTINYQGILHEDGDTASGDKPMTFLLFVAEGGAAVWSKDTTLSIGNGGLFNVMLELTGFQFDITKIYYLGVEVDGTDMGREALSSVFYALGANVAVTAENAEQLDGMDSNEFAQSSHGHDHGSFSGLSDDDHTHYLTQSEGDTRYIGTGGVTFENLNANQDVGSEGDQVAPGNHGHGGNGDGDITAVNAGEGLRGGGLTGSVTLHIDSSGVGAAYIANDAVTMAKIHRSNATNNQVITWTGSDWEAEDPQGGPPTGQASGDLTGTYPGPTIRANAVDSSKIKDGTVTDADLHFPMSISRNESTGPIIWIWNTSDTYGSGLRVATQTRHSNIESIKQNVHEGSCYWALNSEGFNSLGSDYFQAHDGTDPIYNNNNNFRIEIDTTGITTYHGQILAFDDDNTFTIPPDNDTRYGDIEAEDDIRAGDESFSANGFLMPVDSSNNYYSYAMMSRDFLLVDRGIGQLKGGEASIRLDPAFSDAITVNDNNPMMVQITLASDCKGVYVRDRNPQGFTVRELQNGTSNATFFWEVSCTPKGHLDARSRTW